ncbi:hypothetical protein BIV57_15990 [Mangrovactinospora gilvigrisea]|uniref:DUF4232 domain-containing protein n=1 Tax=Mangrovactinospora gilvigrisea TaxID=1428644 RepID=A0A1J7C4L2_9ACTN|nr:DUF4232 domain-containing protein [Mangrovactinospora gilvigrisea]OIV36500.1 hypothetical protein BIV57_15990 [Mangrovactinospora gilvigrisea]
MRTSRIRIAALTTVTAALALGLTACGGADSTGGVKASGSGNISATSPKDQPASNGIGGDGTGGAQQASNGNKSTSGGNGTAKSTPTPAPTKATTPTGTGDSTQACQGDGMLVTSVHQLAGQQGDHLLVTASNAGNTPCWITSYPDIKLNDAGTPLPHSTKDAISGNVHIVLQPGQKAYSAVNLFDYGTNNQSGTSFSVALRDTDGTAGPYYSVDSTGTKFTWNQADVLNWNLQKPYNF